MRKAALFPTLMILCLMLAGCQGGGQNVEATPTPEPQGLAIFDDGGGTLAVTLQSIYKPYEELMTKIAACGCQSLNYALPGDTLAQMGAHADQAQAAQENGRYAFTLTLGGDFSYTMWGLDVINSLEAQLTASGALQGAETNASPTPENDFPQAGISGDFEAEGGGVFSHRYVYDISADGQSGSMEVISTLDGQVQGHERFDFILSEGALRFTDAALDAFHIADGNYPYIIVAGEITAAGLDILEFTINGSQIGVPGGYPLPGSLNLSQLAAWHQTTSRLVASGNTLTETAASQARTYTLK